MLKNWKLSITMLTTIIGQPPFLDSLLMEEMAFRLGRNRDGLKFNNTSKLKDDEEIPIPISKCTISGVEIYQCSDPVFKCDFSELHHHSKRFDCDTNAELLYPSERKSLLIASGPFKMKYVPEQVNTIKTLIYFFRGDRMEVNKLFKSIKYIGKKRNIGYGWVDKYEFEEMDQNNAVVYSEGEYNYLMKTVPATNDLSVCNARHSYGACKPPYWHPENQMEILKPC